MARLKKVPDHSEPAAALRTASGNSALDFTVRLKHFPAGLIAAPAVLDTVVCLHVGAPVRMACRRGGERFRGTEVHGDINLIPAGVSSVWEDAAGSTGLLLRLSPALLATVAVDAAGDPARAQIHNRFQLRDLQIEHLGWALKAELEAGYPSGPLFLESMGTALAAHLLRHYSARNRLVPPPRGGLCGRRLQQVLAYIDDHLDGDLSLLGIAAVAGLSVSHCKTLFRQATGLPVHQYVIRRRVERARALLDEGTLTVSQIALETGFAHQSHLARHLRRLYGVTPAMLRRLR